MKTVVSGSYMIFFIPHDDQMLKDNASGTEMWSFTEREKWGGVEVMQGDIGTVRVRTLGGLRR